MSAKMQVPGTTVRQTNVAIVRLTKNGKRLEIACYKNKVISYRGGQETRLDEVLQIERVFNNVSGGDYASVQDIKKCIGVAMEERAAVKYILDHGELQVAAHEREAELSVMTRDISTIISQKCVNKVNMRPFPPAMIEQALKTCGATIKLNEPAKKQALRLIERLMDSQVIPIDRALMKVRVSDIPAGTLPSAPKPAAAAPAPTPAADRDDDDDGGKKKGGGKAAKKKGGKKGRRGGNDDSDDSDSDDGGRKGGKASAPAPAPKTGGKGGKKGGKKSGASQADGDDDDESSAAPYATNVAGLADLVAAKKRMSVLEKANAFAAIFPKCQVIVDHTCGGALATSSEATAAETPAAALTSVLINIEPHLFRDAEALFASVQVIEHAVMDLSGAFVPTGGDLGVVVSAVGGSVPAGMSVSSVASSGATTGTSAANNFAGIGFGRHANPPSSTAGGSSNATGGGISAAPVLKSALKNSGKGGKSVAIREASDDSDDSDSGNKRGGSKKKGAAKKAAAAVAAAPSASSSSKKGGKKGAAADDEASDSDDDNNGGKQLTAKERRRLRDQRRADLEAAAAAAAESSDEDAKKKGHRKNQKQAASDDDEDGEEGSVHSSDEDDDAHKQERRRKQEAKKKAEEEAKLRRLEEIEEMRRNGEYFSDEEEEGEEA